MHICKGIVHAETIHCVSQRKSCSQTVSAEDMSERDHRAGEIGQTVRDRRNVNILNILFVVIAHTCVLVSALHRW